LISIELQPSAIGHQLSVKAKGSYVPLAAAL
jgi:hypothetical protein